MYLREAFRELTQNRSFCSPLHFFDWLYSPNHLISDRYSGFFSQGLSDRGMGPHFYLVQRLRMSDVIPTCTSLAWYLIN